MNEQESIQIEKSSESITSSQPRLRRFVFATVLVVCAYFTYICISLSSPFYPQVAAKKKGSTADTEVGVVVGSIQLSAVIGSMIVGAYMNKIGVRFLLTAGPFLLGGCTVIFGFVGNIDTWASFIGLSIAINFVMGFGQVAFTTTASTVLVDMFSSRIATIWAVVALSLSLGYITGTPLGGFLYDSEGFFFPFVIIGSVLLLFVPLLLIFDAEGTDIIFRQTDSNSQATMWSLVKMMPVLVVCVSQFLSFAPSALFQTSLPVFLSNTFGWSASQIGMTFFILGGAYLVSAIAVGVLADTTKPRPVMIIGLLVEGCSMLLIGPSFVFPFLSPRPWFVYLAMGLNGVGMAMVTVPSAADMIDTAVARDYEKNISLFAVVSGLINAATFSSGALCSPISGALTAAFGFRQSTSYFAFIIFLHFIVTIVTTVVERRWS
ncbi:MFS-type transporter SLC18B1-like [Corticium candelabrum]|uniref:MFS-type transporter SLC18B1-like n=1 Tax=Corticium candelabrum TaxID=121492 RepID=UPI002E2761D0|nr:MFS-type transporter SLC18B1-like [Corticium candelabrum]